VPVQRLQLRITLVITQDIRELLLELLEGHQDWIASFRAFEPHLAIACQNAMLKPSPSAALDCRAHQGALAIPQHMVGRQLERAGCCLGMTLLAWKLGVKSPSDGLYGQLQQQGCECRDIRVDPGR
jgi:hypothetical protein